MGGARGRPVPTQVESTTAGQPRASAATAPGVALASIHSAKGCVLFELR